MKPLEKRFRKPALIVCATLALMGPGLPLSFGAQGTNCESSCSAPAPSCAEPDTFGIDSCGNACGQHLYDYCVAPAPACGETTQGYYVCSGVPCSQTGNPCSVAYGFAVPGNPTYGFGLPDNATRDLLGLAAKGNIVLGDYTWKGGGDPTKNDFAERGVLSLLQPQSAGNPTGKTQPYVVDPSDQALGYDNADSSLCGGKSPCFDSDYTQVDANGAGQKIDGTPRRFYESSLPDDEFQALVDPSWRIDPSQEQPYEGVVDAVLYTNHALTGFTPHHSLSFFGSFVARDDGMVFGGYWMEFFHDLRLLGRDMASQVVLPVSVKRPELVRWRELP